MIRSFQGIKPGTEIAAAGESTGPEIWLRNCDFTAGITLFLKNALEVDSVVTVTYEIGYVADGGRRGQMNVSPNPNALTSVNGEGDTITWVNPIVDGGADPGIIDDLTGVTVSNATVQGRLPNGADPFPPFEYIRFKIANADFKGEFSLTGVIQTP